NVQCPLSCPICESGEENDWHVLFECENSRTAWQAAGLEHIITPHAQQVHTVKECILQLCRLNDRTVAGKAAMMIWILWQNRNNCVWNQEKEHGQQLGSKALSLWHEWKAVQAVHNSDVHNIQQQQQQLWQAPARDKLKCNVDAGFHDGERKTSAGWCVRDCRGQFVLGGSSWIFGKCSVIEGEAIALLEAMKELQHRGFNSVIFETDALNIENAIRHRHTGVSEFSSIIHKI
ncbi:cytochrome P450, partial [Trifolium medium]|nr:cytochrome P450 [Trifolium medium]